MNGTHLTDIASRYQAAARLIPPQLTAETAGALVQGYWIDARHFYFTAEKIDPSLNKLVLMPSIADCETNTVRAVIPPEVLANLLSVAASTPIEPGDLLDAGFDLPSLDVLAVAFRGHDYLIDLTTQRVKFISPTLDKPALYSPDGRYACVLEGNNLQLHERHTGARRLWTTDGQPNFAYGQASETSLLAVSNRRNPRPIGLWSPDSQWFLTHRIDDRGLPESSLLQNCPPGGGRPLLHTFKYPLPGDPLPTAVLVALHVASGRCITFDEWPFSITAFSPFAVRRAWFDGPDSACFLRLDRYWKRAELIRLDLAHATGRILVQEEVDRGYIDLHPIIGTPNVRTLPNSDEVIWFSERTGWGHLYLYNASTGALKNSITHGEWLVRDIIAVDEHARTVLFLASGLNPSADPALRSLCSIQLDGADFKVLLESRAGDLSVPTLEPTGLEQDHPFTPSTAPPGISPDGKHIVVRDADTVTGNITRILDRSTLKGFTIAATDTFPHETAPRRFTVLAADGATRLHGVMFLPSNFDPTQHYPIIDCIYPGPQIPQQPQSFRSANSAHTRALAELGFVTIMLNTRNTPPNSRAIHQCGYGELLEPQLSDHAAAIRQLGQNFLFIDSTRAGVIGHSGGGAATARALFDYPDVFKVGVSVCGNHDSNEYAAIWSDKYRGPHTAHAWLDQANSSAAHKLEGKLLLVSGDMDENVHVRQTLKVVDALIQANRDFDLLIVPNEGHPVLLLNGYVQRRTWDFFVRHLRNETPHTGFAINFDAAARDRFLHRCGLELRE